MLTGSLAASYHGAPRATQDIDLVVDAPLSALLAVAHELKANGFYVSEDAIREAQSSNGMFNAVDPETGWKIDFIIRKDRPFSRAEFEARETVDFAGLELNIARAEDIVVAKLEWNRLGESEQQLRDVAEILLVQASRLDLVRIEQWVIELGLESQWQRAKEVRDSELN